MTPTLRDPTSPIQYCGIRCNAQALVELDSGRPLVAINRRDIQRIRVGHGLLAQHPIRQSVAGYALIATAYFPAKHIFYWYRHGGTLFSVEIWLFVFAGIGVHLVMSALRTGYFLDVELLSGRKRLAFGRQANAEGVEAFLQSIEDLYALQIKRAAGGAYRLD